jgi:IS605 OrfB family transposase
VTLLTAPISVGTRVTAITTATIAETNPPTYSFTSKSAIVIGCLFTGGVYIGAIKKDLYYYVFSIIVMQRTIRVKIENKDLKDTTEQYFKAYCFYIGKGAELHTSDKKKLHNETYYLLRKIYPNIPSALLQTARDVACENLKEVKLKMKPIPKNKFIRYDKRTFSYKNGIVSLSTVNGRKKFQITLPKFAEKYNSWNSKACIVVLRKGQLWLNIIFDKESHIKEPETFLGIDRGINKIAVCSDNSFYNSKQLKSVKGRYQHLKTKLQSKGTRSAKRHLKRLSGRERRFVRDVNHVISKQIVSKPYDCFVLEDLKIKKNKGKWLNRILGGWSYYQLGNFVTYKAEELGKTTIKVNPAHTSQMCSKCSHTERSNRNGSQFKCRKCGFGLDSDLNASRNIANLGISQIGRLNVIQPIVSVEPVTYKPDTSLYPLEVGR